MSEKKLAEVSQQSQLPVARGGGPKHIGDGLGSALRNVVGGVGAGAAALVAAPVLGAKSEGAKGFAKGLGLGVLGAVVLPVVGVAAGIGSLVGGIANTPEAMIASSGGKEWDPVTRTWGFYELKAEEVRYCSPEADELLTAHVERRKEQARAARGGAAVTVEKKQVKSTVLYDELGVSPEASDAAVKKAYYKLALKCHPDKHPDDEEAKSQFQRVSLAYQVLSDPAAKKRYDASGEVDATEEAEMDPAMFFSMIFGSEQFEKYVGELQLAQIMKHSAGDGEDDAPDADELEFRQQKRQVQLCVTLLAELEPYVDGRMDEAQFKRAMAETANELTHTPFGATLTRVIAYIYANAASKYLSGGLGSIYHSLKSSAHDANARLETLSAGTGAVSKTRAAVKAGASAESACVQQRTEDGLPLASAFYMIVSDDHSKWTSTFFAAKATAEDYFKKLSYQFASVLFQKKGKTQEGCDWVAWRKYGTPSATAHICKQIASLVDVTTRGIAEARNKEKQGAMMGSVFEVAWRISVLDIEATLREATSKLFRDHAVDDACKKKRAKALRILSKAMLHAADASGHKETWQEVLAKQLATGGSSPTNPDDSDETASETPSSTPSNTPASTPHETHPRKAHQDADPATQPPPTATNANAQPPPIATNAANAFEDTLD